MKKQSSKRKKRILMILVIAAIIGLAVFFLLNRTKDESQEVMYKETTVKKGTLTSGVTESGSVDIGTITQDIEALEDIESTSSSSGSSDSSGSAGSSSKGEMDGDSANSSGIQLDVESILRISRKSPGYQSLSDRQFQHCTGRIDGRSIPVDQEPPKQRPEMGKDQQFQWRYRTLHSKQPDIWKH